MLWAVRPSFPITFPMSSRATRNSTMTPRSSSSSSTSTESGSSTSASAMVAMRSFSAMISASRLGFLSVLDQASHRVRGLCTLILPVIDSRQVQRQASLDIGIKGTDVLQEPAIPGVALISDHHAIKGALFGTVTSESDMYSHDNLLVGWVVNGFPDLAASDRIFESDRAFESKHVIFESACRLGTKATLVQTGELFSWSGLSNGLRRYIPKGREP